MKHSIEIGSVVIIYIPSFVKIGPGNQKLTRNQRGTGM
jgi:hypothetical protein